MLGINNRDLSDFTVDIERTFELLADVPAGKTVVSESGFSHARAARRPRARRRRRGPDRRDAHARARHRGRRARADRVRRAVVNVKICGITRLEDAELAVGARRVGARLHPLAGVQARPWTRAWPPGSRARMRRKVELVGVFVNQPLDEIAGSGRRARAHPRAAARRRGPVVLPRRRPAHGREGDQGRADRRTPPTCASSSASTPTSTCSTRRPTGRVRRHRAHVGLERCSRSAAARSPYPARRRADPGQRRRGDRRDPPVGRRRHQWRGAAPGIKDPAKLERCSRRWATTRARRSPANRRCWCTRPVRRTSRAHGAARAPGRRRTPAPSRGHRR